jgi:predicted  nucleic acid-binding Zn ribbon protein
MAESWESNTLYFAALADQLHIAPSQLNVLIPEWTQKVVERIFASHLEDWPALLKSLRLVGDDVRAQSHAVIDQKAGTE